MIEQCAQSQNEQVSSLLQMNCYFPAELTQVMPANVIALKNTIGEPEFDCLLKDISRANRDNVGLDPLWNSRVSTGVIPTDTESTQALASLIELVTNARKTLYENYFPYDVTRSASTQVLRYSKLTAMQMAEYAAKLIGGQYCQPAYLTAEPTAVSDFDLIERLGGRDGPLSRLLADVD